MPDPPVYIPQEIGLNGQKYKALQVIEEDSSIPPERQVFGDPAKVVDPYRSSVVFTDWRGGIGQWHLDTPNPQKAWWSQAQLRHKGHLIPQFLPVNTNDLGTPNTSAIIGLIASDITTAGTYLMYCAQGNIIYWLNTATWTITTDGTHGYTIASAPSAVNDSYAGMLGANRILVFAHNEGYAYKTSGAGVWADETTIAGAGASTVNIKYLAFWDDKFWMISNTGQLYYATTLGTETADALLALPVGSVTNLFVGPDAEGEPILYVATTTGLYSHDFAGTKFWQVFDLPYNANNGLGSREHNGMIYFSSNMAVIEYNPRTGAKRYMGLDMGDGLPASSRGVIKQLEVAGTELLAMVDATGTTSGRSGIYGWDGIGWQAQMVGVEASPVQSADWMCVSSAVGSYRIWWGGALNSATETTRIVRYQAIPSDRINPEQLGTLFSFIVTTYHHTPWFTGGQDHADKIALATYVDLRFVSTASRFTLFYDRDWVISSSLLLDTIGSTYYSFAEGGRALRVPFPPSGDAVGLSFRALKYGLIIASSTTDTVDMRSLTLEYLVLPRAKRRWQVVIDARDNAGGNTPQVQRTNINTARNSQTLVQFTWRDATGVPVQVLKGAATLITGRNEEGLIPLLLVEA